MARNHTTIPYPQHFDPTPCKRCRDAYAVVIVKAERLSRSENWRRFTVGCYCRPCANSLLARVRLQQVIDEAFGGEGGTR